MEIGKGDQAMIVWRELINDKMSAEQIEKTKTALLEYCQLDILAMVKIFQKLSLMVLVFLSCLLRINRL